MCIPIKYCVIYPGIAISDSLQVEFDIIMPTEMKTQKSTNLSNGVIKLWLSMR